MEPSRRAYTGNPRTAVPSSGPVPAVALGPARTSNKEAATAKPEFHIFKLLPAELRAHIWTCAFEPQILRINLHTRDSTTEVPADRHEILPVVIPSRQLAGVTKSRRDLLQTCLEARTELLRFLPDCLPLEYLQDRRTIAIPYHRSLDLICYQYVSPIIFTRDTFTQATDLPPRCFPVQSIAFDEDFIDTYVDSSAPTSSPSQSIGRFLEMMPFVKRIYVVDTDVRSKRSAYPFRIMAGKYGNSISLHQEPKNNPNVLYPRDFYRTVEVGQELCAAIRQYPWQNSGMRDQEISVFVLSPSSSRLGFSL